MSWNMDYAEYNLGERRTCFSIIEGILEPVRLSNLRQENLEIEYCPIKAQTTFIIVNCATLYNVV